MTGFNYGRAAATANRLLSRFGTTGTLRQANLTAGATPWSPTAGAPTDATVTFVQLDVSEMNKADVLVEASRRIALISTEAGAVPAVNDLLAGRRILEVRPLNPGGTVVLYQCAIEE